jgi:hypothetical protein
MALIPKISLSVGGKCNTVTVVESTGVYVTNQNIGGWGGPNIDTSDIDTASIIITDFSNNSNTQTIVLKSPTIDVYSAVVSAPTPGAFIALSDAPWELADGIYKVVYTVTSNGTNYINKTHYELFLCNLCNCKNNLVYDLATNCDSTCTTRLKETLDQLEVLEYGIQTAFACKNFTQAKTLLTHASKLCTTVSDCGCGCGGDK